MDLVIGCQNKSQHKKAILSYSFLSNFLLEILLVTVNSASKNIGVTSEIKDFQGPLDVFSEKISLSDIKEKQFCKTLKTILGIF